MRPVPVTGYWIQKSRPKKCEYHKMNQSIMLEKLFYFNVILRLCYTNVLTIYKESVKTRKIQKISLQWVLIYPTRNTRHTTRSQVCKQSKWECHLHWWQSTSVLNQIWTYKYY